MTLKFKPILGWLIALGLLLALVIGCVLGAYHWKSKPAEGLWSGGFASSTIYLPQPTIPSKPIIAIDALPRTYLTETKAPSYVLPSWSPSAKQGVWQPVIYPPPIVFAQILVQEEELPLYARQMALPELMSFVSYAAEGMDSAGIGQVTIVTSDKPTTPVPEPSCWMMLGAGLALISYRAWRVKRT